MKIKSNQNILQTRLNTNGYDNMLCLEFISYDRVITLGYINAQLKRIFREIDEEFVLLARGFNFDGLYETNRSLIEKGCIIRDNYTNNYRTFKGDEK